MPPLGCGMLALSKAEGNAALRCFPQNGEQSISKS